MKKTIIWLEELDCLALFFYPLLRLFSPIEVRYDKNDASKTAQRILEFFGRFLKLDYFIDERNIFDLRDDNGQALYYTLLDYYDCIFYRFCIDSVPDKMNWFKNFTKSFLLSQSYDRIRTLTIIERKINNIKGFSHEIHVKSHFANRYIIDFFKNKGIKIKQFSHLYSILCFFSLPLGLIAKTMWQQIFKRKINGKIDINSKAPSFWIEFESVYGFWEQLRKVFVKNYRKEDFEIVYYFDRIDTKPDPQTCSHLEEMGLNWIDVRGRKSAEIHIQDVLNLFGRLIKVCGFQPRWLLVLWFYSEILCILFKSIYKKFNVKVLLQHQETGIAMLAQSRAIEESGGIMIGLHWAQYPSWNIPFHPLSQHVFFVWGKLHYEMILMNNHNNIRYVLPSGIWIIPDDNILTNNICLSESVKYKIGVFDSSVGHDLSPENVSIFYNTLLGAIKANPQLGCVIKSKVFDIGNLSLLPNGDKIVNLINTLINEKRIVIFDYKSSLINAALLSDLSVCCGVSSAGFIAGIYGLKSIHWDFAGYYRFPIYLDMDQKIFFPNIRDLDISIDRALKTIDSTGDLGKWRALMNNFNDYKGGKRIIEFVSMFINHIENKMEVNEALDSSVKDYIRKNNLDKNFFLFSGIWGEKVTSDHNVRICNLI